MAVHNNQHISMQGTFQPMQMPGANIQMPMQGPAMYASGSQMPLQGPGNRMQPMPGQGVPMSNHGQRNMIPSQSLGGQMPMQGGAMNTSTQMHVQTSGAVFSQNQQMLPQSQMQMQGQSMAMQGPQMGMYRPQPGMMGRIEVSFSLSLCFLNIVIKVWFSYMWLNDMV